MKRIVIFVTALFISAVILVLPGEAQHGRYSGVPATRRVGVDTYLAVKTAIKTFSVIATGSLDDFQFDNTADNTDEQTIEIAGIVPAYAEILSVQLRCFESVAGGAGVMVTDVGTSDGGDEVLATGNIDQANEIAVTAAGDGPEIGSTAAARSIWFNVAPAVDNWNTKTAGRWAVIVTYIDYGAVHTAKNP